MDRAFNSVLARAGILVFVFLLFLGAYKIRKQHVAPSSITTTLLNYFHYIPPKAVHLFSFGFDNIVSDIVWIATLQTTAFEGDPTPRDFQEMYGLADITTELDPKIELAYRYIGTTLLFNDQVEFGKKLLLKAIKNNVRTWKLLMVLGWYYNEYESDAKTSMKYYYEASKFDDSPKYFKSLVAKLAVNNMDSKNQQDQTMTQLIVLEMLKLAKDEKIREKIKKHYQKYLEKTK